MHVQRFPPLEEERDEGGVEGEMQVAGPCCSFSQATRDNQSMGRIDTFMRVHQGGDN
jgi:hypothetical protein